MSTTSKNNVTLKNEEDKQSQHKLLLDTILVNELGQFGKFQLQQTILCIIAAIFSAWPVAEYLFTTARISSRCLIPECDSSSPEFYPPWLHNAIPGSPGSMDNCQRFVRNFSQQSGDQNCPAELFDQNRVEDCVDYIYENKDTVVYDFGLACDEWRRTLIGSLRTIGMMMALPLTGYISDRWGRRMALTITGLNGAWLGATRYFADSYPSFVILHVIETTFSTGLYTSAYILILEVLGTKYRTMAGTIMKTFWAVGHITLGLIAWAIPNWRNLTLTVFVPQLCTIAFFWTVTESARWFISKGRFEEAEATIQKIARTNGKNICLQSVEILRPKEEEQVKPMFEKEQKANEQWLVVLVFRHKKILLTCIVTSVWWLSNVMVYYGLSINAVNIFENPHLSYVAVSAVEIPGYWISALLMDKIGRKAILATAFCICAACQAAYIFIPQGYYSISLAFYFLGKCSISTVTSVIYIYTVELFPTKHRHTLFAFSSMIGRIGLLVAPLTPAIGASTFKEFPFVLFGSLSLLSGLLTFLMPETRGTKLPDTIEEAENLHSVKF